MFLKSVHCTAVYTFKHERFAKRSVYTHPFKTVDASFKCIQLKHTQNNATVQVYTFITPFKVIQGH